MFMLTCSGERDRRQAYHGSYGFQHMANSSGARCAFGRASFLSPQRHEFHAEEDPAMRKLPIIVAVAAVVLTCVSGMQAVNMDTVTVGKGRH